ncbi:type I methionyl aminopeptidase [Candidatus Parcubacteria bacterium]|nr:MAG: type I methionyl aminopeptidase [Candidatus Parcubacteria bacterium]
MDKQKIEKMRTGGKILADVMQELMDFIKEGVSKAELDKKAEELIIKRGGEPAFKKVPGYAHTTCLSVNEEVVHGIPDKRLFKKGDVVGIDCGVYYKGYYTDMSETLRVKSQNGDEIDKFLEIGKEALFEAIKVARAGNRIGHISKAIQDTVEGAGYSVVRNLIGHGVGEELHQDPEIPGYLATKIEKTPLLAPGMTLAIEVIYNMGKKNVVYRTGDQWTIVTEDKSLSGLFERTVLVAESQPEILTPLSTDKNYL